MRVINTRLLALLAVALIAASCVASEERSGPRADGAPEVLAACAEDHADCHDTIATSDLPTGGDDPRAPSTEPDDGSTSNGMVADGGLSVSEANGYAGSQPVAVRGYVVRTSDLAQLCETLAESHPPQCGGARLALANAEATNGLPLIEDGDVQWSPDIVILVGTLTGNKLTIDTIASG